MKLLHVPRTGGTAIKASLIDGYKRHKKNVKYMATKVPGLYVCDHTQKLDNKDQYIFFVRDPIDRFVSHFVFLKKHAKGYDTFRVMNPKKDRVIKDYDNINDFAKDIFKLKLKRFISFSNILVSPRHIAKYKNNIAFVGRTEHLEDDFKEAQRVLNVSPEIPLQKNYTNSRPAQYDDMARLDEASLYNLRQYLDKDYEIIISLILYGFLHHSYLNEIRYEV